LELDTLSSGICGICNSESEQLINTYREVNKGTEYQAPMKHLLSAFNGNTQKAVLTQPGGVSYRHWLGLIVNDPVGKREPSRAVHESIERQEPDWQLRIWAFGYDMDNMKARCWYESTMPLIHIDAATRADYEKDVADLIKAASEIASNVRSAVKKAWFRRPGDVKGDMSFIGSAFWHDTESSFYLTLYKLKTTRESGNDVADIRKTWHKKLCDEGLRIFDANAWNGPIEDGDPKRVVTARKELQIYNHSKKIKELLGMSVEKAPSGKRKSKKS
jgi:CRISPR system Cascade subunit CasA